MNLDSIISVRDISFTFLVGEVMGLTCRENTISLNERKLKIFFDLRFIGGVFVEEK